MKKVLLLLIPILLLTGCKSIDVINLDSTKEITSNNEMKENVYKYLVDKNYLDEPNLDMFEITNITKKGYYKSNSNYVYLRFDCTYRCIDETDSCILNNLVTNQTTNWLYKEDDNYYFFLEYDLKNNKVIGKRGSAGPDKDFKQVVE